MANNTQIADRVIQEYVFDFERFAERYLRIKNERGDIVPLKFNSTQKKVLQKIKDLLRVERLDIRLINLDKMVLRLIILKARQQGISTVIQAFLFWLQYIKDDLKALTMGHKVDASNNLFDMYLRYYEKLEKHMRPITKKSNEKKISYAKKGSENKIDTAGAGEIGRSDTLQAIHLTEVAFYPDAKTTFLGLLQGAKNAYLHVIESTANGYNEFYNKWNDAETGTSVYIPIFLSWLEFPEYMTEAKRLGFIQDFKDKLEREKFLNDLGNPKFNTYPDEEKILMEEYGATIDQIKWRRYAISNLCDNDIDRFHQEYPRDPEEAFISSGRPVFDMNKVQLNLNQSREPLKTGDLIVHYDESEAYEKKKEEGKTSYLELKDYIKEVEFLENSKGFIKIWTERPEVDCTYRFAGAGDIAEGLEQGDFTSFDVLDRFTNTTYLSWHGHLDPDLFADEVHKIWLYLNKDLWVGIEKNNHGLTVINKLFSLGVNQYYMQRFEKGYPSDTSKIGFQTNSKSKPFMINILNEWIREDLFTDYDKEFWNECRKFVRNARGQMQADGKDKDPAVKNFDDRVISRAIMAVVNNWLPNISYQKEEEIVSRPYIKKAGGKPVGKTRY